MNVVDEALEISGELKMEKEIEGINDRRRNIQDLIERGLHCFNQRPVQNQGARNSLVRETPTTSTIYWKTCCFLIKSKTDDEKINAASKNEINQHRALKRFASVGTGFTLTISC